MAMFLGPSRDAVLRELRSGKARLPMTIGKHAPEATIAREGGWWRLRPLVLDQAACDAAARAALAPGGSGVWMPESQFAYLRPGAPLIEASSLDAFVAALEQTKWVWS